MQRDDARRGEKLLELDVLDPHVARRLVRERVVGKHPAAHAEEYGRCAAANQARADDAARLTVHVEADEAG